MSTFEDSAREYTNGEVIILWKSEKCIHSGNCARGLHTVFKPKERPWVQPKNASSQEIIDAVAKCPSGALSMKEL